MTHLYQITRLSFSYQDRKALELDELNVARNRVTAVVGPNGSGKSTLFDILAFLRKPDAGMLLFRGEPVLETGSARLRRQVGYVQQKPYLMKMSVRDNIGLGLKFRGEKRHNIDVAVNAVAGELGLTTLLDRDANKLSGGEIQKVALARSLALQPEVILMDEPFTYLDEVTVHEIEQWLTGQREARAKTVVFSTHDRLRAQSLSDNVVNLSDGRACPFSSDNLFHGTLDAHSNTFVSGNARFTVPESVKSGHTLFIDPKHLVISTERLSSSMRNNFSGTVAAIRAVNGEIHLKIKSDVTFHAVITRQSLEAMNLQLHGRVWVSCKSSQISVL